MSWLRDCSKKFTFALEASLLGQIFIFGQSLSRGHYQPSYQPPEGVCLLNVLALSPTRLSLEIWRAFCSAIEVIIGVKLR